jgi:hypothetical protein
MKYNKILVLLSQYKVNLLKMEKYGFKQYSVHNRTIWGPIPDNPSYFFYPKHLNGFSGPPSFLFNR